MKLKDVLITLVIIQLGIALYYLPNTLKYLFNNLTSGGFYYENIFQSINQVIRVIINIAGIAGLILYFVQKNNINNKVLKIFLIHHTVSVIVFLPTRISLILDPPGGNAIFQWHHHLFYLMSLSLAITAILVYSGQKIKALPSPVSNKGVRFAHYMIDTIYLYTIILSSASSFISRMNWGGSSSNLEWISMAVTLLMPLIYYTVCEAGFGQTIGKTLTGAYVRSENGGPAGLGKILGRSLCRYIPFEPFSYLPDPMAKWHDKISGTDVFYQSNVVFEEDPILEHLVTEEDRAGN